MGGYSLVTGKGWRARIPKTSIIYGHPGINNLLEFLGMIVNVWLECRSCNDTEGEEFACILALGDNTSAIGWLHKTANLGRNRQAHAAHLGAARHLANVVLQSDCCLASQHIRESTTSSRTCCHSPQLRHLPPTGRHQLLALGSAANSGIITLGRQESSNEDSDRTWRRWVGFQGAVGFTGDPFLTALSFDEQSLFAKTFLQALRTFKWRTTGEPDGMRTQPVVANTVRQAAGNLGATFRGHFKQSPFHIPHSPNLRPVVRALLAAYTNADPSTKRQRAITPKLLRGMFSLSGAELPHLRDSHFAIISEIAIVGFFYAMRSCEATTTPAPGRTKIIAINGVVFRNAQNKVVPHDDPELEQAERVTITFRNQKNGAKDDKRTHQRTRDPVMCPVLRLASIVQRIKRLLPDAPPTTTINTTLAGSKTVLLPSRLLLHHLRTVRPSLVRQIHKP
ncbi:hypothetical protein MHU86_12059 [Fragilaria crotonensis]|nr:hypothetical protein MHU86_12059 [Fragilaria crotonensis]